MRIEEIRCYLTRLKERLTTEKYFYFKASEYHLDLGTKPRHGMPIAYCVQDERTKKYVFNPDLRENLFKFLEIIENDDLAAEVWIKLDPCQRIELD